MWKTHSRKGVVVAQATYKDGVDVADIEAAAKKKKKQKAADKKAGADPKKVRYLLIPKPVANPTPNPRKDTLKKK